MENDEKCDSLKNSERAAKKLKIRDFSGLFLGQKLRCTKDGTPIILVQKNE
jgi:hypothetical protein